MSEEHDLYYYATEYGVIIDANNVTKYKGDSQNLNIYLKDKYGANLVGEKVAITINGKTYYREITNQGYASLAVNLPNGEYDAEISYDGIVGKNKTTRTVIVKTTIFGEDIEKYFKNNTQFYATFLDTNGNPLKNTNIKFNINGAIYTRVTNENGTAKLNINLSPNKYIISSINPVNGEQISNTIIVKPTLVENNDLVKYYRNSSQYTIKLLDGQGNPSKNTNVTFNINGVFYTRSSDENGIASLSINLRPGNYIITAERNGESVSNNIFVLTRLVTYDLSMHYKDGSAFKAVILDENGQIAPNEVVTFNVNGQLYNRTSDSNGIAKLNINLMSGKYIISTYWNKYTTSNYITIT